LETYRPAWPLPKLFQLASAGKLNEGIFRGETINTPSLLCVEDAIDSLRWAESVGGLAGLIRRTEANFSAIAGWVAGSSWAGFLAENPATRSPTSVCLKFTDPWFTGLAAERQAALAKALVGFLESEGVAYDIGAHRDAPTGLRVWAGATVETNDLVALLPWLDWAYAAVRADSA